MVDGRWTVDGGWWVHMAYSASPTNTREWKRAIKQMDDLSSKSNHLPAGFWGVLRRCTTKTDVWAFKNIPRVTERSDGRSIYLIRKV